MSFLSDAFSAAFPFLLVAVVAVVSTAVHDWIERGLNRRRERLEGAKR